MIKGDLRMVPSAPRAPPRSQYQYYVPIRAAALPWATATLQTSVLFLPPHPVEESLKYGLLTSQIHHADGLGASVYWTLTSALGKEMKGENMEVSLSESESLLPW